MSANPPLPDPYAELGISPTASADQIRRAYKRACLRWHPDKHPPGPARHTAELRFKAVVRAYTILADPVQRALHDRHAPQPAHDDPFADPAYRRAFAHRFAAQFAAEGNDVDADSLFESLFGEATRAAFDEAAASAAAEEAAAAEAWVQTTGGDGGAGTTAANAESNYEKPPDRDVDLPLTLEELYTGCVKKRRVRRLPNSAAAAAAAAASATSSSPPFSSTATPAHATPGGTATPTPPSQETPSSSAVLTITIRPGYRPGDRVRFRDAAPSPPPLPPADVVFTLSQKAHPRFAVHADDLHLTMRVRLADALAGATLLVRALNGSDLKVRVEGVITPGYVHVVRGEGMPRRSDPRVRGDLHIAFEVVFPERVEAEDRAAIRDVFARLEARAKQRMSIRRSNSLFSSKSSAANILYPRRNSTGAQQHGGSDIRGKPPPGGESGEGSVTGTEEDVENRGILAFVESSPMASKTRAKNRLRFPSFFR